LRGNQIRLEIAAGRRGPKARQKARPCRCINRAQRTYGQDFVQAASVATPLAASRSAKIPPGHPICPFKQVMEGRRVAAAAGLSTAEATARTRITDIRVEELDRLTNTEVKRVVLRKETP
jgi:hypothetical protein